MDRLVRLYIFIIKKITTYYTTVMRVFIDTKTVEVITGNTKNPVDVTFRYFTLRVLYYLVKILNCSSTFLEYIKNKVDYNIDAVKIVKSTENGNKSIILHKQDAPLLISDIIDYVDRKGVDKDGINSIFLKFELANDANNLICLKNCLIEYKDKSEKHAHTLENILKFNSIEPTENSKINVIKYIGKEKKEYSFDYKIVCREHINYFNKLV